MPRKSSETIDRLLQLIQFIYNSPGGVTFNDIKEEFGNVISKRTLYRDIERLQRAFPIAKQKAEDGLYYWKNVGIRTKVPELFFNQDELIALKISQGFMSSQFQGTFLKQSLDSLFMKIDRTLPPKQRNILEQLSECYAVVPYGIKDYSRVANLIPDIIGAITWLQRLKISYLPANEKKLHNYLLDPYGLANIKGGLYLVGYIHEHREIRTLAVERIKSMQNTGEKHSYDIPRNFSLKKHFNSAFGVISSIPQEVIIRFDRALEGYLTERRWPGLIEIKNHNDFVEIRLKVGITRELISWILSFGPHAKVIKPKSLKKSIKEDLKKTLKKYL